MSSLEIAGLTGKRHADVLRDTRKMLNELGIGERNFASSYLSDVCWTNYVDCAKLSASPMSVGISAMKGIRKAANTIALGLAGAAMVAAVVVRAVYVVYKVARNASLRVIK
ncbi:hypothetical protein RZS28_00890 [Methylocapsa polymorpha]|uniref:Uncharacterized protein n=1 Tax=Methylocapsa polymorpha TaxID=3080828 RepID=A0ABZ0HRH3_9HYPH|nr:hypothetical protein RZS28_00890 [Methylocapsa sp. RX1]